MKKIALLPAISTMLIMLLVGAVPVTAYQWDVGPLDLNGFVNMAVPSPSFETLDDDRRKGVSIDYSGWPDSAQFTFTWLDPGDDKTWHEFNYERDGSLISLFFDSQLIFSHETSLFMPVGYDGSVDQLKNTPEPVIVANPLPGAVFLFGSGLIGLAAFRKKLKG
jgi:hypothetical protein